MTAIVDQSYTDTPANMGENRDLRAVSSGEKLAQSFTPTLAHSVVQVTIKARKIGSPTGNLWVTVETDNSDNPSGSALGTSANIDVSTLSTDVAGAEVNFTISTSGLSASTLYWIVMQGDWTRSDTNHVHLDVRDAGGYAGGKGADLHSGTWTKWGGDFYFKEWYEPTQGGFLLNFI